MTVFDLDSSEERGGTSLSNLAEAELALHLYRSLDKESGGLIAKTKVAIITPYSEQVKVMRKAFSSVFGSGYDETRIEVNTVDSFQGREAPIVIFSCVRAAGSRGIGFLSDVRRMNVGLTRAKHFLFIIARCDSIVANPYWRELTQHAWDTSSLLRVPFLLMGKRGRDGAMSYEFPNMTTIKAPTPPEKKQSRIKITKRRQGPTRDDKIEEEGEL